MADANDETSEQVQDQEELDKSTKQTMEHKYEHEDMADVIDEKCISSGDGMSEAKARLEAQDPYFYLQRKEFTSEIFKISIDNLPRFGFNQLKKKLNSMNIVPRKMKALPNQRCAWVTFVSEAARNEALEKLDGHVWKSCTLKAKKANPSKDPLVQKRSQEEGDRTDEPENKKGKADSDVSDGLTWEERLSNSVTPLYTQPYDEQLKLKQNEARDVLDFLTRKLKQTMDSPVLIEWLKDQKKTHDGLCSELLPIKPSPVLTQYRNKSEFTIGKGPDGQGLTHLSAKQPKIDLIKFIIKKFLGSHCTSMTVGFCFGLYKDGYNQVGNPQCVNIIRDGMKKLLKLFEDCLRQGPFQAFDTSTHEGQWRTLTLRETRNGDLMAILRLADYAGLSKGSLDAEKLRLSQYFTDGPGKGSGMVSFYLVHQQEVSLAPGQQREDIYEHIMGQEHITEDLMGLKFRVSPDAFFQVNTLGCEVLYKQIGEWCKLSDDTTLLDVCCGTGTIGLTLAKRVFKVIGIEMCKQAIDDAKKNAEINGIKNVAYFCCKAEDIMKDAINKCISKNIVAVVDPPRAGLHNRVIQALRNCRRLSRIVYVSCGPKSAVPNFLDLIKAPTNRVKGQPFELVKAIPIDLFPQTRHYELVLLFERNFMDSHSLTTEKNATEARDAQSDILTSKDDDGEARSKIDVDKENSVTATASVDSSNQSGQNEQNSDNTAADV